MAFFDSLNYTYGTTATTRRPTSVPLTFQTLPKPKIFSFTHLRSRSQQTNARLRTVLNYWRACHRPTHHAKRRASSLNLRVDTVKAYHCDQKQVSTIPLPELDLEPSPPPAQLVYPVGCAPIRIGDSEEFGWPVIPDEEDFSSSSSTSGSSMSMSPDSSATSPEVEMASSPLAHKATRPKLRCIIPPTDTPACVEIERSYFSPDSEYSATTLESSVTDEHMAAPQPMRPIQLNGALAVPVVASGRRLSWACSDISDCDIEVRPPSSSPSSSLFGSSSSSSDGDRSSSAPLTPEDAHLPTLRIKRKYDAMEDDSGDDADLSDSCDEIRGIFDKRPRFERKNWAGTIEGGQPISRPCAPVHGSRERRRSYGRA